MKNLDLTRSIYDLTAEYPELIDILKDLGFWGIANPVMRNTAGRVTTLPQGCAKMGVDMADVAKVIEEKGFVITGGL